MNPLHNAVWLYLGSEARNADEIAALTGWCERNRVGKVIVYLHMDSRQDEAIAERVSLLAEACASRNIELHGMVSTLIQRVDNRDSLLLQDKSCYCVDAHGISTFEEPIVGKSYVLDPRHPDVIRTVSDKCAELLRRFPGLNGIHLDFVRYYHYDSRLEIDTKSAGHWIGLPKAGQPIRLETADGVRTTFFIEQASNLYNDPPIGDKLVLSRSYRYCFCEDCLSGFERHSGLVIPESLSETAGKAQWLLEQHPAEWAEYRASIVTGLVGSIRAAVREERPDARLSAAIWYNAPYGNELRDEPFLPDSEYECFGQKWWEWVERGYLDFVCPMDYWMKPGSFGGIVDGQLRKTDGRVPVYAGLLKTPEYEIDRSGYEEYARMAEAGGAAGICFFHYGSWKQLL
ncbi:hypothetical protein FE784_29320 [Paenibacillus hemerocallicola]|uniref:Glycosyl hydrolase-like 10 domain-containing protein n=1 Tax=Paenibacillus hemerocallicola TaxID=1172614 RepID=A0A5C4T1Q3_9BACL|nr:hypothetical protein [Paenibacillus hemerocallicola]TNJ62745.1 hypothetical protein FE784_29320 [Paenibacillus hemerocallicola]